MKVLNLQEAQEISRIIRAGKNHFFKEYKNAEIGIFYMDNCFQIEYYDIKESPYDAIKTSYVKRYNTDEEFIAYLIKQDKHHFEKLLGIE